VRGKEQASRLATAHARAYPRSPASDLNKYAFRGVEYYPGVRAQVQLSEAELARLAHDYRLVESPGIDSGALPAEFNLQVREGQLVGVNAEGCVSLVPLTPTRFAIPDNPGLTLDSALDGERVQSLTLRAGKLALVYEPQSSPEDGSASHLFDDVRAEIERQVREEGLPEGALIALCSPPRFHYQLSYRVELTKEVQAGL
jgi:hypothetical protein